MFRCARLPACLPARLPAGGSGGLLSKGVLASAGSVMFIILRLLPQLLTDLLLCTIRTITYKIPPHSHLLYLPTL